MKNKKAMYLIVVLMMLLTLVACSGQKIQGTYVDTTTGAMSLVFEGDTMKHVIAGEVMSEGKWSLNGNTVTVVFPEKGTKDTYTYDEEKDTLSWLGVITYCKS